MKQNLTEGKVVSAPLAYYTDVWGAFAVIAFNLVDTYFVSQLGTEAIVAMSYTSQWLRCWAVWQWGWEWEIPR